MALHTVEKIGGTSMSEYISVRDNIILQNNNSGKNNLYQRIFVVSAYSGITNLLLEHKKNGTPGIYGEFAENENEHVWQKCFDKLQNIILEKNSKLFFNNKIKYIANSFIIDRLNESRKTLKDLADVCAHGHFALSGYLLTVREMLASIGEAHSGFNMALLLQSENINAKFMDLTGWNTEKHLSLDECIYQGLKKINLNKEIVISPGYAHCTEGLMASFDRGYSEMTFSRIAVLSNAKEAIIHKEYHLSSADPKLVGIENAIPIGRTNYDVADQLANLGMEAIHPKAAKGLRQKNIPLRIMNTFEPDHNGTLITGGWSNSIPRVEIIAGRQNIYGLEVFDQEMMGAISHYDGKILEIIENLQGHIITKDINANTVTHYLASNLKTLEAIKNKIQNLLPDSEIIFKRVALVSAIGSNMKVSGILAQTSTALANAGISIIALHQTMRQVDMQFIIEDDDYDIAVKNLHRCLIEVHNHGKSIAS